MSDNLIDGLVLYNKDIYGIYITEIHSILLLLHICWKNVFPTYKMIYGTTVFFLGELY